METKLPALETKVLSCRRCFMPLHLSTSHVSSLHFITWYSSHQSNNSKQSQAPTSWSTYLIQWWYNPEISNCSHQFLKFSNKNTFPGGWSVVVLVTGKPKLFSNRSLEHQSVGYFLRESSSITKPPADGQPRQDRGNRSNSCNLTNILSFFLQWINSDIINLFLRSKIDK